MDYAQVNDVLNRANVAFEQQELYDLQSYELDREDEPPVEVASEEQELRQEPEPVEEMYVGDGGTEPPDYSPDGDPIMGSDQGVGNLASDAEFFMSFISDTVADIAARCGVDEQTVMSTFEAVVGELAAAGVMAPIPDVDMASSEELADWAGKAKTGDLVALVADAVRADKGEPLLHVTAGA